MSPARGSRSTPSACEGATPTTTVKELLSTSGYDRASVDALLARLAADGLIEDGDELLRLTPAGAERYASVSDRIGTATRRVFSLFDATRVETARALLQQIAETDPGDDRRDRLRRGAGVRRLAPTA